MFRGKNYKESAKLIDKQAQYEPQEAFELITKTAKAKFDETVELHVKLGVDSRHADQQVRGAIVLPHGTGKTTRVLVFCKEEQVQEALDAGAEDMKVDDDAYEIYTAPNDFSTVREALEKQGVTFLTAEVDKIPQNTVALPDEETIQKIQKLLEMLEDNDDVQNVYHNAELPEEEDDED